MRRDFTFIDDIVSGVVACLDNPSPDDGAVKAGGSVSPHRVYNIGNNRPEELMHMIDVLEEAVGKKAVRSEEHTSALQSLMRISYAVFCLKKKKKRHTQLT